MCHNKPYFFVIFSVHLDKPWRKCRQEFIGLKQSVFFALSVQKSAIFDQDLEHNFYGKLADLEASEPEEDLDGLDKGVEGGEALEG